MSRTIPDATPDSSTGTSPTSEDRYYQLLNSLDDGFCISELLLDEDGTPYDYRFLEVNPTFEHHTGLKDATGQTAYKLIPGLEPHWLETYAKVALQQERLRFEQKSAALGRWYEVYAFPFGPAGSHQFAIQFKDITDRKLAEAEAQRQQQYLRALFAQAPVSISIYSGPDYVIDLANPIACKIMGKTAEEMIGRPLFDVVPEARGQGLEQVLDEVMRTGTPSVAVDFPITLKRQGVQKTAYFNVAYHPWQEGQTDVASGELIPVEDRTETITGVVVVGTEVTEQVEARQKVEKGERRSRQLLEGIPQMTWTNLPDGRVNFYSQRWFEYTGLTYEQLQDWGWKPIVHTDDLDEMLSLYLQALATGEEFMHENRLKRHDGSYRWHLNRSVPLRDEDGQIMFWVGTSTDIHEKKITEEALHGITQQLAATNEELQAANEEIRASNEELASSNQQLSYVNADMDSFIYTASHDLKAPITNIQGLLQLLEKSLSPESRAAPRTQKVLSMIQKSVTRFMNTIADLSEITRLQKQANQPVELINLEEIIQEVSLDIAPAIEEAHAQLDIQVTGCDPIRFAPKNLRSVVYNLLSNAIKYRDPKRAPVVQVRCEAMKEYHLLTVADNGLGMTPRQTDKLFTMFQRFHDHVEGTGVGLYIVKKIVENAGGRIVVESQVGEGTTFHVFLKR